MKGTHRDNRQEEGPEREHEACFVSSTAVFRIWQFSVKKFILPMLTITINIKILPSCTIKLSISYPQLSPFLLTPLN